MISSNLVSNSITLEILNTLVRPAQPRHQQNFVRIQSKEYLGLGVLLIFEGEMYEIGKNIFLNHIELLYDSILELSLSKLKQRLTVLLKADGINLPQFMDSLLEIGEYIISIIENETYDKPINTIYEVSETNENSTGLRGGSMADKTTSNALDLGFPQNVVIKEVKGKDLVENGASKLRNEVIHILTRRKRIRDFFPEIYEFTFSKLTNYTRVVMPRYFGSTDLSHIILDSTVPIQTVKSCYIQIFSSLFSNFYIINRSDLVPSDYVEKLFFLRVKRRINQVLNEFQNFSTTLIEIIEKGFVLNNITIPPLFELLSRIQGDKEAMDRLKITYLCESHHDLIASNIVVDFSMEEMVLREFKLVDCRGENETGKDYRHWIYDLCKSKFFISAYDLIRRKYVNLNIQAKADIFNITLDLDNSSQVVHRYRDLNSSFFELIESSKSASEVVALDQNWKEKVAFGEGIMFIADIPPRIVDEADEEMVIAFYCYGMKLLMEYIENYLNK